MKTKMMILGFAFLGCASAAKAQTIMNLQTDDRNAPIQGSRSILPTVEYDDSHVMISSKIYIADVMVLIKDVTGAVLFKKNMTLLPTSNALDIPQEYNDEKYKIELVYDKSRLYGFFSITSK